MTKTTLTATACATLLWAGMARATPTAQHQCDYARITAWKTYGSCIDAVVAKEARLDFINSTYKRLYAMARCRHAYFKKWAGFQSPLHRPSLTGSTCVGDRITDNGDRTVTDNLTTLVWEKKESLDGAKDYSNPHDSDNDYTWSAAAPYSESGTAFTEFLRTLNGDPAFAGSNGWRLPTFIEIESIIQDYPCTPSACNCQSHPCIVFDASETQTVGYFSSTTALWYPGNNLAWYVDFYGGEGLYEVGFKLQTGFVRAVRGGL